MFILRNLTSCRLRRLVRFIPILVFLFSLADALPARVQQQTDRVTVSVGPVGGFLHTGRFTIIVPPGAVDGVITLSVVELPTQTASLSKRPGMQQYRPIGPAYQFEASRFPAHLLNVSIAFDSKEIPEQYGIENLAVVKQISVYAEDFSKAAARAPGVTVEMNVPLPVTVYEHEVVFSADANATFQLVVAAERPAAHPCSYEYDPIHPYFIYTKPNEMLCDWIEVPPGLTSDGKLSVEKSITRTVRDASNFFYDRGFFYPFDLTLASALPEAITVKLESTANPDSCASVDPDETLTINVDPFKLVDGTCDVRAAIAHEYFHLVQLSNLNSISKDTSTLAENRWFLEGTAKWAEDAFMESVNDNGKYFAPTGDRFLESLNMPTTSGDKRAYQTVAFWKWLEEKVEAGLIAKIIADAGKDSFSQFWSASHSSTGPVVIGPGGLTLHETPFRILYLDEFNKVAPLTLSFLDFVASSLYWKDYDDNETGPNDIWSDTYLGSAFGKLTSYFTSPSTDHAVRQLKKGGDGDGEARAITIPAIITRHLSGNAYQIANATGPDALVGRLNIEFSSSVSGLSAAIISQGIANEITVNLDISPQTVKIPFFPDDEIIIIVADRLFAAPEGQYTPLVRAWVDNPCTAPIVEPIVKVSSVTDLLDALAKATPGTTVQLGEGSFTLSGRNWAELGGSYAGAIVGPGVTLAGSGKDKTTLTLQGEGARIVMRDQSILRDIRVDGYITSQGGWQSAIRVASNWGRSASVCKVDIRLMSTLRFGQWSALEIWDASVIVNDSTLIHVPATCCDGGGVTLGIFVSGNSRVVVTDSTVTRWRMGLEAWGFEDEGTPQLHVDCKDFTDNWEHSVWVKYTTSALAVTVKDICPAATPP